MIPPVMHFVSRGDFSNRVKYHDEREESSRNVDFSERNHTPRREMSNVAITAASGRMAALLDSCCIILREYNESFELDDEEAVEVDEVDPTSFAVRSIIVPHR